MAGVMLAVSAEGNYSPDALRDEVHNLPGAPHVPWRMFAGYIDVSHQHEEEGSIRHAGEMKIWKIEKSLKE